MKILYGICGLGRGHVMRQFPILQALVNRGDALAILAYGESLSVLRPWGHAHGVCVEEVAVPFVVGTATGIDLVATQNHPDNQRDFEALNAPAKAAALNALGTPDVALSDYEPTVAEVAYAHGLPLVTIDQQSKMLLANNTLPPVLAGLTAADEVARLRYFFPTAAHRLACSFFRVGGTGGGVRIVPSPLRSAVLGLSHHPASRCTITVYATTTNGGLHIGSLVPVLAAFPNVRFHVFTQQAVEVPVPAHITIQTPGEEAFLASLAVSHGVIATAGHSLLSEAVYLGLPVLAIPTAIYEQYLNATIIQTAGVGLSVPTLTPDAVSVFLENLTSYKQADTHAKTLYRRDGTSEILDVISHVA